MSLESDLADLRKPLLRFAQLQLRNHSLAEDVVAETPLALLEKPGNFEGRRSLRTSATGIPLQVCVDRLPAKLGRIFLMREWLEQEVEVICGELDVTAKHCGVMLYRAACHCASA
jgi:DNA-directed RNA polymerase specialized sigma24 family protein